MDKYRWFPEIKETVNGKEVSILGVTHIDKFFNLYESKLNSYVTNKDALVLEGSPPKGFWEEEGFFNKMGEIARKQEKKVYRVDPLNKNLARVEGATWALGPTLIYLGFRNPKKEISRRDFLKRLGLITAGSQITLGNLSSAAVKGALNSDIVFNYGIEDLIQYGTTDYRNIVIADSLERICHKDNDIEKLGAIHGCFHSDPIRHYLKFPESRRKRVLYLPFDLIGNKTISEYTPIDGEWHLTQTF
jgi:hypothetical protein